MKNWIWALLFILVAVNLTASWAAPGMTFPNSVAVDASGNLYVADTGNNRIQKFDASGNSLAIWGSLGSANGQFNNPSGISIDASGNKNLYVADTGNNRIQKLDASGNWLFTYTYGHLLTVTIPAGTGSGLVVSDTGGINCSSGGSNGSGTCSVTLVDGTTLTLTATTTTQLSTFDGWSGGYCSGFAPCLVAMTADRSVSAGFGQGPNGTGPMAKIGTIGYNSVKDAYSAAGSNTTILAVTGTHALALGPYKMDQPRNIILKGGYDPLFSNSGLGLPTVLQGILTIQSGSLRTDNVKIQ